MNAAKPEVCAPDTFVPNIRPDCTDELTAALQRRIMVNESLSQLDDTQIEAQSTIEATVPDPDDFGAAAPDVENDPLGQGIGELRKPGLDPQPGAPSFFLP